MQFHKIWPSILDTHDSPGNYQECEFNSVLSKRRGDLSIKAEHIRVGQFLAQKD